MDDDRQPEVRLEGAAAQEIRDLGPEGLDALLRAARRLRLAGADAVSHLMVSADAEEFFRSKPKSRLRDLVAGRDSLHVLFAPSVLSLLHILRLAVVSPSHLEPDHDSLGALADAVALRRTEGGKRGRPPKEAHAIAAAELERMVSALVDAVRRIDDPEADIERSLRRHVPILHAARGARLVPDIARIAAAVDDMDGKPSDAKRRRLVKAYLQQALDLDKPAWKADSALLRRRKP